MAFRDRALNDTPIQVVIPCYNEAERLDGDRFVAALEAQPRLRFLFVDDGSTDDTRQVLQRLVQRAPDRMAVHVCEINGGKGEAVRQGLLEVLRPGDAYVGYWDADLATPLDEVPRFAALLDERAEFEVVLGSRVRLLGREIDRKLYRHLYGRVFATSVSLILGTPVYDSQCGAKLFRPGSLLQESLAQGPFLSRWIFDVELLARLICGWESAGVEAADRMVEQPLRRWKEVAGSKVKLSDALRAGVELRAIAKRYQQTLGPRRRRMQL